MRAFFDSSALAKLYIAENGSERVRILVGDTEEVLASVLVVPEVISALNQGRREHRISSRSYSDLKSRFLRDVPQWSLVGLDEAVIRHAVRCLESGAIRTLDALQVGSAREASCDLFVSADGRQCRAGKVFGLRVELVEP